MPLTLVLGPANSAKAGEVLGAYARAAAAGTVSGGGTSRARGAAQDGGALLIVPTAADAGHYDRELAASGTSLGRALTFDRLLEEIARRTGVQPPRIGALTREQLIRRVLAGLALPEIGAAARGPGFPAAASRWFAQLRRARVTPARLTTATRAWAQAGGEREGFADDLARLYRAYDAALRGRDSVDAETFGWTVLDALRADPGAWGRTAVFFYGFDDLTEIERDAVQTLAAIDGTAVTLSLTYEPGRVALAARAGLVEDLRGSAEAVHELPAAGDWYDGAARDVLHHLERHLFEPGAPRMPAGDAVALLEAGGARAEAELVAAEVLAALRGGVRPEEIVVVCRSLARSGALLEELLGACGVPVSSGRRVPLARTGLGRALIATVRCALAVDDAELTDVLTCLRATLDPDRMSRIDELERELRRAGTTDAVAALRAARAAGLRPVAVDALAAAEDLIDGLVALTRQLAAAPALTGVVRGTGARGISDAGPALDRDGAIDLRAAGAVLAALGELESGDPREMLALIAGIELPVHASAVTPGTVRVAEPLAIRAQRFRRVFVTGLCEGEFPTGSGSDPFLPDERRRELAIASGLALPPPEDVRARERYLLYACVSRATERVTLSYRSSDEEGNQITPSPFIDDVADLLELGWRDRRRRRLLSDVVWPARDAPTARDLALALIASAEPGDELGAEPGAGGSRFLDARAVAQLRHTRTISASALEKFVQCPVAWLIDRQLAPDGLDPDGEAVTRGSILHDLLATVVAELRDRGLPLGAETLPGVEAALDAATASPPATLAPGQPDAVRRAVLRGIQADLLRYLRYEASADGGWVPRELEYLVELEIGVGDDAVAFTGKVDRIDVARDGSRALVRDYKSGGGGGDRFGVNWVRDGNFQAGLYLGAVERLLGLEPAGALYQPVGRPDLRPRGAYLAGLTGVTGIIGNDAMDAGALSDLLADVEAAALDIVATIRRGELTPCPQTCSRDGCRHPGICWASR